MSRSSRHLAQLLLPLILAVACSSALAQTTASALTYEFAAMDDSGWTGADASWSARLPDRRIVWLFGDTFIGGVDQNGCRIRGTPLIHNSVVVQTLDGSMRTIIGGNAHRPEALVPGTTDDDWYWPGPPVVADGVLEVPMAHILRTGPGDWQFKAIGTSLATFSLDDLQLLSLRPLVTPPRVNMASAAVTAGRYTYVYGTRDYPDGHKDAYLARTPARQLSGRWLYWKGSGWSASAARARPVLAGVSNQFSVIRTASGWRLVTQIPMTRAIVAYVGASPIGPWRAGALVAAAPDIPHAFTYNATVHTEFSHGGWWVIGVNVNGRDMDHVFADADLYKPRFLSVRIP